MIGFFWWKIMNTKIIYISALFLQSFCLHASETESSNFSINSRLFDYQRDYSHGSVMHDTALGGLINYNANIGSYFEYGVSLGTSNSLIDHNSKVYGLVANNNGEHESITRMQNYYIKFNILETDIKYGAQQLSTPMMNGHDIRLLPKGYRGLSLVNNSIKNTSLTFLKIDDYIGWSDEEFNSIGKGVELELKRLGYSEEIDSSSVLALGVKNSLSYDYFGVDSSLWYYDVDNAYGQSYFKADFYYNFDQVKVTISPTYIGQYESKSLGVNELDAKQYGGAFELKLPMLDIVYMYAKTDGNSIISSWGESKIIQQQVNQSGRKDENAHSLKLSHDFSNYIDKLSVYVQLGLFNTSNLNLGGDLKETEFGVVYDASKYVDGLKLRARYSNVDGDVNNAQDLRFYVYYNI